MKRSRLIRNILLVAVLFAGGWVVKNHRELFSFPGIISAYYAKEFCSCHFVEKRDEAFCHAYARQYIPIQDFKLEGTRVTVRGLFITNSASHLSEREGCRID